MPICSWTNRSGSSTSCGFRPAHVHFLLSAEGHQELATALYIAGDEHIESDAVFGVSRSLIVDLLPPSLAAFCF